MKFFSTFTGVLGFDMGLPPDWECIGVSEIDKNAVKVLRYRLNGVRNYGDIEKIRYEELPDFDVLVGGSPCQGVSMAGKREGLADSRSRLFFSYIEILKVKKPRYFIFENVKGLLSSDGGWDFAEVLNQFSEAGYDAWWQVLDATQFGIPQHRERVFILGTLGDRGFREVFFEPKHNKKNTGIPRQTANTITRRYRQAEATGSYIAESKFDAQIETMHFDRSQQNRVYGVSGIAPTLHRKTGGSQVVKVALPVADLTHAEARQDGRRVKTHDEPSFTLQRMQRQGTYDGMRIRYLTPLECERLMGWPNDWTRYGIGEDGNTVELSDNARYNLIGNGVVPQAVRALVQQIMIQT